jgi:hypothetical protein
MRTGSSELASEDGVMLLADSITLASPVDLAHPKGNMIIAKNQVSASRGCSIGAKNVGYGGEYCRMGCFGLGFRWHAPV